MSLSANNRNRTGTIGMGRTDAPFIGKEHVLSRFGGGMPQQPSAPMVPQVPSYQAQQPTVSQPTMQPKQPLTASADPFGISPEVMRARAFAYDSQERDLQDARARMGLGTHDLFHSFQRYGMTLPTSGGY